MKQILITIILALMCINIVNAEPERRINWRRSTTANLTFCSYNNAGKITTGVTYTLTCGCADQNAAITVGACNAGTTYAESGSSGCGAITVNSADTNGEKCIVKAVASSTNYDVSFIINTAQYFSYLDISSQTGGQPAIKLTGNTTGAGLYTTGGATSGAGIYSVGGGTGTGVAALSGTGATGSGVVMQSQATNGVGLYVQGNGGGNASTFAAGATGNGLKISGGATSGDGLNITTTAGDGIDVSGTSTNAGLKVVGGRYGILSTGGTNYPGAAFVGTGTGAGLYTEGGATGSGIKSSGVWGFEGIIQYLKGSK